VTVALALALTVAGCARKTPPPPPPEKPAKVFEGSAEDVTIVLPDALGRKAAVVHTRHSDQIQSSGLVTLRNTDVTLYDRGAKYAVVEAPAAILDTKAHTLTLSGGIEARILKETTAFHVDRLVWNSDTGIFVGEGNVRFASGPVTLTGRRITGRTPLAAVEVTQGVRFQIRPRP
jgi:LPS export ABC transporter protein LptC